MPRYNSILDGASLTDEDESGTPAYYGYTRPGGTWAIMRYNSSTGKYDFHLNDGPDPSLTQYDTDWTNRASITYTAAGRFKSL